MPNEPVRDAMQNAIPKISSKKEGILLAWKSDMIYRVFRVTVSMRLYVAIWLTMKMFMDQIKHFRVPYIYVENTNFPDILTIIFLTIYCHVFDGNKFNILEVDQCLLFALERIHYQQMNDKLFGKELQKLLRRWKFIGKDPYPNLKIQNR